MSLHLCEEILCVHTQKFQQPKNLLEFENIISYFVFRNDMRSNDIFYSIWYELSTLKIYQQIYDIMYVSLQFKTCFSVTCVLSFHLFPFMYQCFFRLWVRKTYFRMQTFIITNCMIPGIFQIPWKFLFRVFVDVQLLINVYQGK